MVRLMAVLAAGEEAASLVSGRHDAGKVNAVDRNRWFPIPQIELDNNLLLEQNPLWK